MGPNTSLARSSGSSLCITASSIAVGVPWRTHDIVWPPATGIKNHSDSGARVPYAEKALGPEHPKVATSLENYAGLLRATGRTAEADEMEARAKAIRDKRAE